MKFFKSILMLSALVGVTLTSCSDDGYWDEANKANLGKGVLYSFNNNSDSYVYGYDETVAGEEFSVIVTRSDASKAETLPLTVSASDPTVFTAEEAVYFEAGKNEATYTITLAKELELEETENITVSISPEAFGFDVPEAPVAPEKPTAPGESASDEEKAAYDAALEAYETEYAEYEKELESYNVSYATYTKQMSEYKLSYTVTVTKEGLWNTIGEATFYDNFTFSASGYPVTLQQNGGDPTIFRLVKPYAGVFNNGYDTDNIVMYLLQPGETLAGVDITENDLVFFDTFGTGEDYDETSHIYALHPAQFTSLRKEESWLHSKVLEYQDNGLPGVIQLAPFFYVFVDSDGSGLGGWNYTGYDNIITIVFPGYSKKDYSTEVVYNGLFVDPSDNRSIYASATFGSDVASATAVLVPGKDAIVDAYGKLGDDSYEYQLDLDVSTSDFQMPMIADASTGTYTLAVFTFDEEGEWQDYNYVNFNYTGSEPPETWTAIAVGDYTYGAWAALDGAVDEGLTLYQSDSNPTKYKIENWGFTDPEQGVFVDFEFTYDSNDGTVHVGDFENGYVHPTYGAMSTMEAGDYFDPEDSPQEPSYFNSERMTFYFNVVYYVQAGYFGYGWESFRITGEPSTKARKAADKNVGTSSDLQTKFAPKKVSLFDRKHVPFYSESVSKRLGIKLRK